MSARFEGKVAVITGAANGFGRATAERLASEGARLVLVDKAEEALRKVSSELNGLAVPADVSSESDVESWA